MKKIICLLILALSIAKAPMAQVNETSDLFIELAKLDSLIFEQGFNKCQFSEFESYISEDLEFYHDQGGLSETKEDFINAIKQNICSNSEMKPIRKLVANTLKVYPLYNNGVLYGAIQSGEHEFYIAEPDKEPYLTSSAKFSHVWIKDKDSWKLKRVLSFDHQVPKNINKIID
jgi:uncharacterized protein DUF4440